MRLTTGIEVLDRRLAGGVPAGSLITLTARPDTQCELLLAELAENRETLYISTVVPESELKERFGDDSITVEYAEPESLLKNPHSYFDQIGAESNVIVDPVTALESIDRTQYLSFMNELKRNLRETDSIGLFYCIDDEENPPLRSLTLKRTDMVWRLYLSVTPLSIENQLVIAKFRGGRALQEPIRLILTDRVWVDTSQNIA